MTQPLQTSFFNKISSFILNFIQSQLIYTGQLTFDHQVDAFKLVLPQVLQRGVKTATGRNSTIKIPIRTAEGKHPKLT